MLNEEMTASYSVVVTAREASGDTDATVTVNITVRDVNEAPMVAGGATMLKHAEDDADISTDDPNVLTVSDLQVLGPRGRRHGRLVATGRRRRQVQHRRRFRRSHLQGGAPTTRCLRTPAWTTSTT